MLGAAFGVLVQRSHFCTMGAVSDFVLFQSRRRLRVWALAIATALLLTQLLRVAGILAVEETAYRVSSLPWLGAILGGLLFGHGTVLAGGCAARAFVRTGAGSLKALYVLLLMGLTAGLLTRGPLASATGHLIEATSVRLAWPASLDAPLLALGLSPALAAVLASLLVLAPLLAFVFADPRFRHMPADFMTGAGLGAIVAGGWLATALAHAPPASLAFVEPAGFLLAWLVGNAGEPMRFVAAAGVGVILGAAVSAQLGGQLRLETFAGRDDMLRHGIGGVLMGAGGALAGGCSIGQGVTGTSTLAIGSFLTLAAIILGSAWGVKALEVGRYWPRWSGEVTAG
jgi:uncharacterized membrane protein YedE/YeeE